MAQIEIFIKIVVDTTEYVEPTPTFEADPEGFVKEIVNDWRTYGFEDEWASASVRWSSFGFTEHDLGVVPE
jgi:hypothetical protein